MAELPRAGRRNWSAGRSAEGAVYALVAAVLRRRGWLLAAPVLYVSAMLLMSWDLEGVPARVGVAILRRPLPGSVYRSPLVFERLWPYMQADVNHSKAMTMAWHQKASQKWKSCFQRRLSQAGLPPSNGFLIIEANGGLNQQRLSICDAVAVAGLLNATLVIPYFHLNSVWRDSSKFGDIFDEDHFIERLKDHVRVVRELPEDILQRFDNNISSIVNMRTKALQSKTYYLQKVLPKLLVLGAIRIAPFSNRLAQSVPSDIQALRCLSNFEALRFSGPIGNLADKMVQRMVKNSSAGGGKYISVHLRFEEDMVAFSCCTYDGGQKEKHEMDKARERGWRGKFHKANKKINPEENRRDGKCPLSPLEVGVMLRGMGFDNTTSVYVASGKIYNAEKYMVPLRQLFPLLETKDTLASPEELGPFRDYSSRLAALDYTVCAQSEVFVTTQGGNFPHFLIGHRRFLYGGHSKTIKPDKRRLVLSFDNPNISLFMFNSVVMPALLWILPSQCRLFGSEQICESGAALTIYSCIRFVLVELFYVFWFYPLYVFSIILSTLWYNDIAKHAFEVLRIKGLHRTSVSGETGLPDNQNVLHSSRPAGLEGVMLGIGEQVYSFLLLTFFFIEVVATMFIPYIGTSISFLLNSWMYAYYCFEYKWNLSELSLDKRLEFFETNWAFFAGFGSPCVLAIFFFSRLVSYGVMAILFPLFVLTAAGSQAEQVIDSMRRSWGGGGPGKVQIFYAADKLSMLLLQLFPRVRKDQ